MEVVNYTFSRTIMALFFVCCWGHIVVQAHHSQQHYDVCLCEPWLIGVPRILWVGLLLDSLFKIITLCLLQAGVSISQSAASGGCRTEQSMKQVLWD